MSNHPPIDSTIWIDISATLPAVMKEVAVKGGDTQGEWRITGGVWWQPYKGQLHTKGRWMQKDGLGKPMRLPESDDVTHWRNI